MTTAFQDMAPDGTLAQQELLFRGQRAIVAAPVLAWASLTNGYTFVTITPAGATDSRTINAALAASTDRPTFCAALAAELNMAGTTAYDWAVNTSSPVDGLIGTAKTLGAPYNSAPTGTALVGGVGSISTAGADPIPEQGAKISSLAQGGFLDEFANLIGQYAPGAVRVRSLDCAAIPNAFGIANFVACDLEGGGRQAQAGAWVILTTPIVNAPKTTAWALGFDMVLPVPASGQWSQIGLTNAAGNEYIQLFQGYSVDTTHLYLNDYNAGAGTPTVGPVVDGRRHRYVIAFDTITCRLFIDNLLVASRTALTKFPVNPMSIGANAATASALKISTIAWATL